MSQIFIATPLPDAAIDQLKQANISFDYWDSPTPPTEEDLIRQLDEHEIIISAVNITISAKVIAQAPHLKLIANAGDGVSNIDVSAAKKQEIAVTNAPTLNSIASTAEQTVTLLLALSRDLLAGDQMMRANAFPGWQVTGYLGGHQVYGKKIVIIGMGRVGKQLVKMLHGFDLDISYVDPIPADESFEKTYQLTRVSLEDGLKNADYISLNCDLTDENLFMIRTPQFELMKPTAYLINCARGKLVKEADLVAALQAKKIAGAALDVYEFEPKVAEALTKMPNVVLTPHAGNATYEARLEMAQDAVTEAINFLQGKKLNYPV